MQAITTFVATLAVAACLVPAGCSGPPHAAATAAPAEPVPAWHAETHLPFRSVAAGAPFGVEAVVRTPSPWTGTCWLTWERRDDATEAWVAVSPRANVDPPRRFAVGAGLSVVRAFPTESELWQLTPGTWRVRCHLIGETWGGHLLAGTRDGRSLASETSAFEVVPHAANERAMRPPVMVLVSAWQWAVGGSMLPDDMVIPDSVRQLGGMLPRPGANAEMAAKLMSLRSSGCSREVVVAAELVIAMRDLRRVHRQAAGEERRAAAGALQTRLEALLAECPLTDSPFGGQHADVLAVLVRLLALEDRPAAIRRADAVRAGHPLLAAWLDTFAKSGAPPVF